MCLVRILLGCFEKHDDKTMHFQLPEYYSLNHHSLPSSLWNLNLSTLSPTRLALKSVKVQIMALLLPVT